jgi:hypothetical protein
MDCNSHLRATHFLPPFVHAHMHVNTHVYTRKYSNYLFHVHSQTCTHTHTHTRIHTHTHTHTHTHARRCVLISFASALLRSLGQFVDVSGVCVCVYGCVKLHVRVGVFTCMSMDACSSMFLWVCLCVCVRVCACVCVHVNSNL